MVIRVNDAVSFYVSCKDQQVIDRYWSKLLEGGGSPIAYGWLKDKYGARWQVVPETTIELMSHAGATRAMMQITKLDIAALEEAAREG